MALLEKDLELIDNYLSNQMEGSEREAFERRLQQEADLSKELRMQQHLVEGIRTARVAQLKSMLNAVPVTSIPSTHTALIAKIGSVVIVTGALLTATYVFFKKNPETPQTIQEEVQRTPEPEVTSEPVTDVKPAEETVVAKPEKVETSAPKAIENKPVIKAYDPAQEESEPVQEYEKEQLEIISKAFVTSSIEVETNTLDKRYSFHYVFNDGKLILYGSFEKNLYEILEFITDDEERTVVLFYKSNYYLLDINKTNPTPLSPIRNKQLLKKLTEYRE